MSKKSDSRKFAVWVDEGGGAFRYIGTGEFKDNDPASEHILVRSSQPWPWETPDTYDQRMKAGGAGARGQRVGA